MSVNCFNWIDFNVIRSVPGRCFWIFIHFYVSRKTLLTNKWKFYVINDIQNCLISISNHYTSKIKPFLCKKKIIIKWQCHYGILYIKLMNITYYNLNEISIEKTLNNLGRKYRKYFKVKMKSLNKNKIKTTKTMVILSRYNIKIVITFSILLISIIFLIFMKFLNQK